MAHRRALLEAADRQLADARASETVASKCSLIDRIGVPDTGSRPAGPGRLTIAATGVAGGLIVGFGILVLTVPAPSQHHYRPSANGNHRVDDAVETIAVNGHPHRDDLLANRFAGVP